ncbi:hypothetical protein B4135_3522 [Caldibacillus debilis]|uniref:Uncharacterized protein n=1 Tax=Caldibacillus debilis TaxID=301148 RepID=A0A150LDD8_9BACI|nr:hypothetical protein B4135_3522 [Caldibacillus debilis]
MENILNSPITAGSVPSGKIAPMKNISGSPAAGIGRSRPQTAILQKTPRFL